MSDLIARLAALGEETSWTAYRIALSRDECSAILHALKVQEAAERWQRALARLRELERQEEGFDPNEYNKAVAESHASRDALVAALREQG